MLNLLKALWSRRARHADPLMLLCVIGSPLLVICILAILVSEGIDITFLVLLIAFIAITIIVTALTILAITVSNYLIAQARATAQLLRRHTPPPMQVILRLLPRLIKILALPMFLLSLAGDTSGLLGLLCCLQICCILSWIGLFTRSCVRAWRLEAQARQQERRPAGQMLLRAIPVERVPYALYAQPTASHLEEYQSPTSSYADYEQPQTQYPIQMPPT